jgi:outer membrane protein OmpA-like peptidoglycan-associated protein/Tol biopolymer transport system component
MKTPTMNRDKSVFIIFLAVLLFPLILKGQGGESTGIKKPVPVINKSDRVEFSPTISADGRTMIYETQNGDKWELYQSHQKDGVWSEPIALEAINSKCQFIGGPALSYDGNTLYYTAFIEEETTSEDIYYSVRLSDSEWSAPKSIGAPINSEENYEGFPSISADGHSLYFIRINPENDIDRKSKEPCFTIYVSRHKGDGTWGDPSALPAPVNTGCERDPRIMADNHTLIFSSIRAGGKGKYDLYQSRLQPDGNWAVPIALDYVNSADNDQSPCISASGNNMFLYSNEDIYEVEIPKEFRQLINVTMLGKVLAKADQSPLASVIQVKNISSGETFSTSSNPADGQYSIVLAAGREYDITVTNASYLLETIHVDYRSLETYKEERRDFLLASEFTLLVKIKDKDLPNLNVRSFLSIKNEGTKVVFSDSVVTGEQSVVLAAGKNYTFEVYSPGYLPMKEDVTFGGEVFSSSKDIAIEHEKVRMSAEVTDISTGEKKRLKVTYKNETTDEVIIADAGEVVNLRKGDRYQIVTNSDKGYAYAFKSMVAQETGQAEHGPLHVSLPVAPLVLGAKLTLNHIYFQTNSAELSEASALELNTIVQLLQKNPQITIEISAHSDDVGSDDYNLNLSQKRASGVTDYLKKQGIPATQLVAKGYGKTHPVVPNDTDENRAKNRRVELLVLKVN